MSVHGFNRLLVWHDFRPVDKSLVDPPADAQTKPSIGLKWGAWTGPDGKWKITSVTINIGLDREGTWAVKGRHSAALLKHEQGHYDIAAVAARTLDRQLIKLHGDRTEEPQAAVDRVVTEILGDKASDGTVLSEGVLDRVQSRYDEDPKCGTNHSRDVTQQAIWEHRIHNAHLNRAGNIQDLDFCPKPKAVPAPANSPIPTP